jgi:hypothetical protein
LAGKGGRHLKRVAVFFILVLIAGLMALAFRPALLAFHVYRSDGEPAIDLPPEPSPRDFPEARRQDVADLARLPDYDRSFTAATEAQFRSTVADMRDHAAQMSDAVFMMAVSRAVALTGNGHTTVSKRQRAERFGRIPLRLAWFADGLYVVRALQPLDRLLGRRVIAVDGRPVESALAAVRAYLSGTEERARDDSSPILESPALLQAVWPDTDGDHLTVGFDDGTSEELAALPSAPDPFALQPIRAIGPTLESTLGAQWRTTVDRMGEVPLSLRLPQRAVFSAPLDHGGAYIRINANEDDERGPLRAQLAEIAGQRPPGGWRWIMLDLRFNDGGDETKILSFTRALPGLLKADGNLWIVTGNATFSAAIITAARAKNFLGARAHIVGENAGDKNPFWSTGGAPLVLRNSGIAIAHAYFKQDWERGCRDIETCYPGQFFYGVAAGDLSPEVTVGWRFADYAAGRDTVMDKVAELEAVKP